MHVHLIFPPQWTPTQPYLGVACLSAYLKREGIDCQQTDLNAVFYNYILQKSSIQESAQMVEKKFTEMEEKKRLSLREKQEYKKIAPLHALTPCTLDNIAESIRFIKSKKALSDITAYNFHLGIITYALQVFSAAHDPLSVSLSDMTTTVNMKSSQDILERIYENTLLPELYEKAFTNKVVVKHSDIYGISITGISQIFPALFLAHWIKQKNPSTTVIIGGSVLTRCVDSVSALNNILQVCDGIIVKEGEIALSKLCKGYKKEDIPGLVYKKGKNFILNNTEQVKNLDDLPTPDFMGLDFDLYFSPEIVLPMYATRACYWGKCAFCDHGYGYHREYRMRSPEKVVEDLIYLSRKWGTKYFTFSDESIHPQHLLKISLEIIKRGLDVKWITNVRGEGRLTKEICDTAFSAGGRVLLFGFESGSQRVLDVMRKGIRIEGLRSDLKCSSSSGMWNHGFFFFGFPGETPHDALKTINFVKQNRDILHSVGGAVFTLGKHSHILNEMSLFEVKSIELKHQEDMALWIDCTIQNGLSNKQASNISKNFENRLKSIYPYHIFSKKAGREHLLLFMDTLGRDKITNMPDKKKRKKIPLKEIKVFKLSDYVIIGRFKYDFMEKIGREHPTGRRNIYVVFDILNEKLLEVSETAYFILGLCDENHSLQDIAEALSIEYGQPFDDVLSHTSTFVSHMYERGIIVAVD